jgi:predicted ester cyclase
MQGHHYGEFAGIPATGRLVSIELFEIVRVAQGKIAERWLMRDRLGEMLQLGVSPATVH